MSRWNAHLYDVSLKYISDYGKELVALLNPKKDELIVDLGCGTGSITNEIAVSGAKLIGVDSSPSMIQRAKEKFPKIEFIEANATDFQISQKADAVFSNAALHWIVAEQQEIAIQNIRDNLKVGGRLVAEVGGKGNIQKIISSIDETVSAAGFDKVSFEDVFCFPSIGEYATLLEKNGYKVEMCHLFDRPTAILNGINGFKDWVSVFGISFFQNVPSDKQSEIIDKAIKLMMNKLEKDDRYFADYVRLRVIARKI
jgi:trans-aconitate methyltransferase